jgi:hypothetical protein
MIDLRPMALERSRDVEQAVRTGKLPITHGQKVALGSYVGFSVTA